MNIYLDIDGVLLTKQGKPADFLKEFLEYITGHHSVYWLTTHCKGDPAPAVAHLKRVLPIELHPYLEVIKATDWDVLKIDGIDFTQEFRWLEDFPMQSEIEVLKSKDATDSLILIDLKQNPLQLKKVIQEISASFE